MSDDRSKACPGCCACKGSKTTWRCGPYVYPASIVHDYHGPHCDGQGAAPPVVQPLPAEIPEGEEDFWTPEMALWSIASLLGSDREPYSVREAVRALAGRAQRAEAEAVALRQRIQDLEADAELAAFRAANEQREAVRVAVEAATRGVEKLQAHRERAEREVATLRQERDFHEAAARVLEAQLRGQGARLQEALAQAETLRQERDALARRLLIQERIFEEQTGGPTWTHEKIEEWASDKEHEILAGAWERAAKAEAERDALRAEVERLRADAEADKLDADHLADILECGPDSRWSPMQHAAEKLRAERDRLLRLVHPWYGPCDGFGKDGACSECERLQAGLESGDDMVLRLRTERDKALLERNDFEKRALDVHRARADRDVARLAARAAEARCAAVVAGCKQAQQRLAQALANEDGGIDHDTVAGVEAMLSALLPKGDTP